MNVSMENLISSLQDNVVLVECLFQGSSKRYTYKVPADWEVVEGDHLVVDSPINGATLVEVDNVTDKKVDLTSDFVYKWAICKVDRTGYNERITAEKEAAETLKELRRKNQQKKLLEELLGDMGEEAEAVISKVRNRL